MHKQRTHECSHVELNAVYKNFNGLDALIDVSLSISKGEFISLLGPSGCGKTTTLRLIAGLERLSSGRISIDDSIVSDSGNFLPPEKRGVGIVFQDYALFPHMTTTQNIAFGLYGQNKKASHRRVGELLDLVGLNGIGEKYPHELSGGQRQRVALARALAPSPSVILLDEPFSNLDAELRVALRQETKEILKRNGSTVVLVTHDQEEAFSLSDRIGVLNAGRLEQVGTPFQIYHHPANRFIANFVGKADYIPAAIHENTVISKVGRYPYGSARFAGSAEVELMVRPDDVRITSHPQGEAIITELIFLGAEVLYTLELPDSIILHSFSPSAKILPLGSRVKISIDLAHTVVFPKA